MPLNSKGNHLSSFCSAELKISFNSLFTPSSANINSTAFVVSSNICLLPRPKNLRKQTTNGCKLSGLIYIKCTSEHQSDLPNAEAARLYSLETLVENTPESSVQRTRGCFAL